MSKPVILTGLRANNDLHIGNYFGALLPMIDMARSKAGAYQINLFVPDLHSFTTPIDHSQLQGQVMHTVRLFVAAGLDLGEPDIHVYRQSYIPAHSELTWILDCFTGTGEMGRMTQYKDKSAKLGEDRVTVGLYHYPVLMAADMLLYDALYVPVGEDQTQHIEFTRDIAERLNAKFKQQLFVAPKPVKEQHEFFGKDQGLRIRDLQDPAKKMSKSDASGKGIIFMGDEPASAAKKIMSAATDSHGEIRYDMAERPGISNLLQILSLLTGQPLQAVAAQWQGKSSYGDLKAAVAAEVSQFLVSFQGDLAALDPIAIDKKLQASEAIMNKTANAPLLRVQQAVGLRP